MIPRPSQGEEGITTPFRRKYGFGTLWLGQTISLAGTQISALALPLVAVVSLGAASSQLGVLNSLRYLPFLLFALPLGPLIDRGNRRWLMICTDWARGLVVAVVPLLYMVGLLNMWCLFMVAFALGSFQVLFDSAYMAFVPQLVGREQLTRANRNLQASQSAADLGGPGLGGVVCAALGAPMALAADAISFAVSALTLSIIRSPDAHQEKKREKAENHRHRGTLTLWWREVREGLAFIVHQPELRALTVETATFNAFEQGALTLYLVYAVRELHFSAVLLGISLAAAGVGSLAGTMLSEPASRRCGLGRTILAGSGVGCAAYLLIPAAGGSHLTVFFLICAGFGASGIAIGLSNVLQVSLRQASTPDVLLGRMTTSFRFVAYGTVPVGSMLGGFLGEVIGLRPALWVMSAGLLLGPLAIACSPLPRRRALPTVE